MIHISEFESKVEWRAVRYSYEPQKQDTQANKRSPLLSEEVPYQITLIRLRQGSLDRRRREKVIWKMFTENVVRESSKPCKLKKMQ